jgi:hypothetical protein
MNTILKIFIILTIINIINYCIFTFCEIMTTLRFWRCYSCNPALVLLYTFPFQENNTDYARRFKCRIFVQKYRIHYLYLK